jgi:hypothetical protein
MRIEQFSKVPGHNLVGIFHDCGLVAPEAHLAALAKFTVRLDQELAKLCF